MGSDVNVTCGGREIIIAISSDYIQRNLEWLENGNKLSLTDLSCKAVQDRSGNRIIRIRDDFTKCGNRITTDVSTQFSQPFHTSLFSSQNTESISTWSKLLSFTCKLRWIPLISGYIFDKQNTHRWKVGASYWRPALSRLSFRNLLVSRARYRMNKKSV